jgi:hypothetical protein
MVRTRSSRSQRRESSGARRILDRGEAIREFLAQRLPPGKTEQADYLTEALLKAGARYDRYAEESNRNKWLDYAGRGSRFAKITRSIEELVSAMSELDVLSRDDLRNRVDPAALGAVEAVIGSLLVVGKATNDLAKETQNKGRPRDLAEERWLFELADIYANAFSEPARVWRSDDGLMSDFYRLLELSRPETFPRHGKLSRRQIARILSERKLKRKPFVILTALDGNQPR